MGQLFAKVQEVLNKYSQRKSQVNFNIFGNKKYHAMIYVTYKKMRVNHGWKYVCLHFMLLESYIQYYILLTLY